MVRKIVYRALFYIGPTLFIYFIYKSRTLTIDEYKDYLNQSFTEIMFFLFGFFILYYVFMVFYGCYDIFKNRRDNKLVWFLSILFLPYIGLYIYLEKFILSHPSRAYIIHNENQKAQGIDQPEPGLPIPKLVFRRACASLFDYGLFSLYIAINFSLFAEQTNIGYVLRGFPALIALIVWFLYFPIIEGFFGKTLGKKILKIQVVRKNGEKPLMRQTIIRHLMDIPDMIFFTIFNLFLPSSSHIPRRLGDRLGKTWVIYSSEIVK